MQASRAESHPVTADVTGRPALLVYSQHSVGLGHLVRSLSVAEALAEHFRVVVVSGGPVPHALLVPSAVELVALDPIGSRGGADARLASLTPDLTLEQAWDRRRGALLHLLDELQPAALVVELFPLGRRKFAREIIPLLEHARTLRSSPAIICSVRDILVTGGPGQQVKDDEAADRLNHHFDALLVHGDPSVVRLEDTFQPSVELRVAIHYTGYVVPRRERLRRVPIQPPEILVSAGGGKVGADLLRCAAEAHRRHFADGGLRTRIVTGPFLDARDVAALAEISVTCPGLSVERFIPDLAAAMATASASVSQCGYNTALDIVRSGVPSLVVPHDEGRETEQAERARRLADLGVVRVVRSSALTPRRLADEVTALLTSGPREVSIDLDGALTSARLVAEIVDRIPARSR